MSGSFSITVNGKVLHVEGASTHMPLLDWLRSTGMTGSKQGCNEGDCGACTVALVDVDAAGRRTYRAINSCIALLPMLAGREIVTVEGLAEAGLHPVQSAMVSSYGSQCGYCTPGFVVSMFEAFYRDDLREGAAIETKIADQLSGNLCRCTGYRPIRDAMVSALAERPRHDGDLFQVRLSKSDARVPALSYEAAGERFLRPTSLEELLSLRAAEPDAELVAGATEIGVYVNKRHQRFPTLISTEGVAALRAIERRADAWVIGGAANLTDVEDTLGKELPLLRKMLLVFASRQIRSRATLAGNLVTASPIGDMAPVLLSLDARIELTALRDGKLASRELLLADFFVGYRKTAMEKDELVTRVIVPHRAAPAGGARFADSYKVSKRRELDISIVAASFVVETDAANVVSHARLAYGGVAATPIRARAAEAELVGKPWTAETIAAVAPVLARELTPIADVRSGVDFRRGLVVSLLEKFQAGETSAAQDEPLSFVRGEPTACHDASRALSHESAVGHVTGAAVYVDDEAHRRGPMLEIWPVMAPHARARILRRDATAARAMPGVACVLLAEDVPGHNDVGAIRKDEPLLAKDEVLFHGQPVAIVVGASYEACRLAAAKVEVDYEPLPAVLGLEQAIAENSFHTDGHRIRRGDVDAALAKSPSRLSGTLTIGGQEHFYLETHAAWAEAGEDGEVHVVSSTQHPSEVQAMVSHVLDIPRNRVVVVAPRMGGGFGGKETQGNLWASVVALAAVKTKQPVRVQLDRDLDMMLTGKRHPFRAEYEVGHDAEGHVLALRATLISDGGWALDLSESINDRALFHVDNAYYVPAVDVLGRVAKTNVTSHTAFRGFGGPQGMLVIEEVMDRVARATGLLPEVVRERNLYRGRGETNTTHYGQELEHNRIGRIWPELARASELAARREEIAAFNAKSRHVKRGIAITPVKFGISFTATWLNQAGALVHLYRDGSAQVNHGGTEMGQGLYTKILGVAMRELGLPESRVRVMKTRTDKVPNTSATAASSGADLNGAAVKDACETLRARLAPVAGKLLAAKIGAPVMESSVVFEGGFVRAPQFDARVSIEDVCGEAYMQQIAMSATGFYRTPAIGYDRTKGRGKPFHYFAYGAAVAEVEVDGLSGMKLVRRVDILHDVGDSLNPGIDRGQVEGAFVQGVGWLTGEELSWDAKGRLASHSASTYQIPSISDAPVDFRVRLLPDAAQESVVHGSKAVGEPPLMLAIAVREAIRDAVAAFGKGGDVPLASPATHEAIYAAIRRVGG